jgi:hypothetical protein
MPVKQHSPENGSAGQLASDDCVTGDGQRGFFELIAAAPKVRSLAPLLRGEGWDEGLFPQIPQARFAR